MINALWSPGPSLAAVTDGAVILMDASQTDVLFEFYEELRRGAGIADIMRLVNRRWDSLSDIPDFALVFAETDGVRVAVRGKYSVSDGSQIVNGSHAISWLEAILELDCEISIGDVGEPAFPTAGGIVPAGGVQMTFSARGRPSSSVAALAVAEGNDAGGAAFVVTESDDAGSDPVLESAPELELVAELEAEPELELVAEMEADPDPELEPEAVELEPEAEAEPEAALEAVAPEAVEPEPEAEPVVEAEPTPARRRTPPRPKMLAPEAASAVTFGSFGTHFLDEGQERPDADAETAGADLDASDTDAESPNVDADSLESHAESSESDETNLENTIYPEDDDAEFSDLLVGDGESAETPPEYPEPNEENQNRDAAPKTGDPVWPAPRSDYVGAGDHDGATIAGQSAADLQESIDPKAAADVDITSKTLSARCANGHPNPPYSVSCRDCGSPVSKETEWLDRPNLGALEGSNGVRVNLDADIIIGRKPSSSPEPGRARPHLVTVPSPDQQISRSHCEIRVDGWDMRLVDRNSNNGTFLLRPGQNPVRVSSMSPSILNIGDVIDIGENIRFTVERS